MTTQRRKRCAHCKVVYYYYASGRNPRYNDDRYCPECQEAIENILNGIPVKFTKKWIEVSDYTREEIVDAQEKRVKESAYPMRRVLMPLFDMRDPDNKQERVCEQMADPVSGEMFAYSASWWSKHPDDVELKKNVWWDVEKDTLASDQTDKLYD